jgi:hypothetical protein
MQTNSNFGPIINISTPGYFGSLSFVINSVTARDITCVLSAGNFTVVGGTQAQLRIQAWPIDYTTCSNGFYIEFTARRSNNVGISAMCGVNVSVLQVTKPPIITDCGNRTVNERSISGTLVGTPLLANNPNGT